LSKLEEIEMHRVNAGNFDFVPLEHSSHFFLLFSTYLFCKKGKIHAMYVMWKKKKTY
jgi:hypothetical protein